MPPSDPPVIALMLAAGAGRRFDGPGAKLAAPLAGGTVLGLALAHALDADIGPVVAIVPAAGAYPLPDGVIEVVNPDAEAGQATSLAVGVDHARAHGAAAVVVGLGDQPGIEPAAWRAVAAVDAPIVVATYAGRIGHPVRLRQDVWPQLPRQGDRGAGALVRGHPELVTALPCNGSPFDIDTVEDLHQWQSNS